MFDSLQATADDPIPHDPSKRMKIYCDDKMITYLKPSDKVPSGPNRDKTVCK